METFTWTPDHDATRTLEPRLNSMQFGDGYEQDVGDGINFMVESWDLTFSNRTKTEINAIEAFLATQGGHTIFQWVTPHGSTKRFRCKRWRSKVSHDYDWTLSATFDQHFGT